MVRYSNLRGDIFVRIYFKMMDGLSLQVTLNYLLESWSFYRVPSGPIRRISQFPSDEGIEKLLFHFANQIGAFILYILIEATHPTRNIIPVSMRKDKAHDFIQTAIPYSDLFEAFLINVLPKTYRKDIVLGVQIKENSFDRLSSAFAKVYPNIYKTIEEGYPSHFQDFYSGIRDDKCEHEWKETFVHKIGTYYKCTKCHSMAKSITEP